MLRSAVRYRFIQTQRTKKDGECWWNRDLHFTKSYFFSTKGKAVNRLLLEVTRLIFYFHPGLCRAIKIIFLKRHLAWILVAGEDQPHQFQWIRFFLSAFFPKTIAFPKLSLSVPLGGFSVTAAICPKKQLYKNHIQNILETRFFRSRTAAWEDLSKEEATVYNCYMVYKYRRRNIAKN